MIDFADNDAGFHTANVSACFRRALFLHMCSGAFIKATKRYDAFMSVFEANSVTFHANPQDMYSGWVETFICLYSVQHGANFMLKYKFLILNVAWAPFSIFNKTCLS